MNGFSRRDVLGLGLGAAFALGGCRQTQGLTNIGLTIDWVPSAEYYGFFTAKALGFYEEAGLHVPISNGSGAPAVASQLLANSIAIGTTTSDNLVRIIARGAQIARAVPILPFNPATLITRPGLNENLQQLVGRNVGVNVQSAPYLQFQKALAAAGVPATGIREYPVGFGGVEEFASGRIDALLGYTSNHAVDLAMRGVPFAETLLGTLGIRSAGLVLVATAQGNDRFGSERVGSLVRQSLRGYTTGGGDPPQAVEALRQADPTLSAEKLRQAVLKLARLAREPETGSWDTWMVGVDGVTEAHVALSNELMNTSQELA
jgi:NitT/TauT family transport system substrate-binding protein